MSESHVSPFSVIQFERYREDKNNPICSVGCIIVETSVDIENGSILLQRISTEEENVTFVEIHRVIIKISIVSHHFTWCNLIVIVWGNVISGRDTSRHIMLSFGGDA